jgi:hypothetical protein
MTKPELIALIKELSFRPVPQGQIAFVMWRIEEERLGQALNNVPNVDTSSLKAFQKNAAEWDRVTQKLKENARFYKMYVQSRHD